MQVITKLYKQQQISLERMKSWEKDRYINLKKTFNTRIKLDIGYLCDPPGFGKTLVLLYLLLEKQPIKENYEIIHNSRIGKVESKLDIKRHRDCSIIVSSLPNLINWEQQIHSHCGEEYIKSCSIIKTYNDIKYFEKNNNIKLVIISSQKFNTFFKKIGQYFSWNRVIYDDYHILNIKKNTQLDTCFTWLVSGTPEYTNNSYGIIKQINDELMFLTHNVDIFEIKQRKKFPNLFIESKLVCNMPKLLESTMYCIYDNYIFENNENVLLKLNQYTQNNQIPFASYFFQHKSINSISNDENILRRLKNTHCSICYDKLSYKSCNTCCYNTYCLKCNLKNFFREGKCPICRRLLNMHKIVLIDEICSIPTFTEQLLYHIYKKRENIIVYSSQYKKIQKVLKEKDIVSSELKNITIYNQYKEGRLPILLLHPHNFGQGYDLSNTDKIIIIENETNKQVLKQVIGRVQRLNRKESIKVIYLKHYNF